MHNAISILYFNWKQTFYKNPHLEDGDRSADDEDEDVRHGEVDEEHVDHGLEAGARGHWQDDLRNITKCQLWSMLWRNSLCKFGIMITDQDGVIIREMREGKDNPVTRSQEKITQ